MPAPIWNNRLHPFVSLPYRHLIAIVPETASSLTATVQLERVMFRILWISSVQSGVVHLSQLYSGHRKNVWRAYPYHISPPSPFCLYSLPVEQQFCPQVVDSDKSLNERNHLDWMSHQKWLKANRAGSRIWEASSAVISIIRGNSFHGLFFLCFAERASLV